MKTLQELKDANLEPVTLDKIGVIVTGEKKEAGIKAINEYLSNFVYDEHCIKCGDSLGGFLGMWEWGLAYGEGRCSNCGYPGRACHDIKDWATMNNIILQYHPKNLEEPVKEAVETESLQPHP